MPKGYSWHGDCEHREITVPQNCSYGSACGAWPCVGHSLETAVLQLLGPSRCGTAENWLSWGMGRSGSRDCNTTGLESTVENLWELGVQLWQSWALWWSITKAVAVGARKAGMWQGWGGRSLHRNVVSAVLGVERHTFLNVTSDGRSFGHAPKKAWWLKQPQGHDSTLKVVNAVWAPQHESYMIYCTCSMVCPDSETGTDNIVRSLEGDFGGRTGGWALVWSKRSMAVNGL